MKKIKLTQGKHALVSDRDYKALSLTPWHIVRNKYHTYAYGRVNIGGKLQRRYMHQLIIKPGKGHCVDHRNGNGLDNRRKNLRVCTFSQNQANRVSFIGTSKYKGVHWCNTNNRWVAKIMHKRKSIGIGYYKNEKEAARNYNAASLRLNKGFAKVNKL